MHKEAPDKGLGHSRKETGLWTHAISISEEYIWLLKAPGPGVVGGLGWSKHAAGIWRLSSAQLGTQCLTGKFPRRKASLRVTCCGCAPWDLKWGEAGVLG